MGWVSESGEHEGWVSPVFSDGYMGGGSTLGHVIVTTGSDGQMLRHDDWQDRPMADVVGWVVTCDCHGKRGQWLGMRWERVARPDLQDLAAGRLYSDDEDTADVGDREDVEQLARASWRGHVDPTEGLADLRDAAADVAHATERLNDAVRAVRDSGASWGDVAQAVGLSRQGARQRWGN